MSASTVYLCDGCGKNLSMTDNAVDYRLRLTAEVMAPVTPKTPATVPSPLAADAYFCGFVCLEKWMGIRRESNG